ncbi:MAG: RNA polymerase sigma factor SigJ [Planctomycetota bacterium]
MTGSVHQGMTTAADFARERDRVVRFAYRMLGSLADAEDMAQETFLRWRAAGEPDLENPSAWMLRTCTRLCLDRQKAVQRRREAYVGEWLPEPLPATPREREQLDESLSLALLRTIQRLPATERAVFLLHDVFGDSFAEVAAVLDLTPAHCRQLGVRARRHLRGPTRSAPEPATVDRLADAFFAAIASGDLPGLRELLASDVVLHSDGGGKAPAARAPIDGAAAVARFFTRVFATAAQQHLQLRPAWFNGAPGRLVLEEERVVSAFHFHVEHGRIAAIFVHRNPDKLTRFDD